ncbi:Fe(3+) ABC transporter substrate-binding protein [Lusitaniella coriacea LEGE 07157]|uniref:Fe(3+) ABC transporter substrate-binding protein n=1 Tax=Lusitaniella coriacea LEGE 07157 TaxID=945747 RepID=A0A8J7IX75_9CYAN|nr:Fe(3+) ABC transporter substrate-binding protein [Lusitaniella coriacea]MBE9118547.1 Fe(3+) ABC transporter substrate-binding protein [Lusitaniella coriacea LEGE 07157]
MNPKITRRTFLVGSTALTAIIVGKLPRASAQTTAVNLYSSRHYDTDEALYSSFRGGRINLIEGKAGELIERIKSESTNSPADLLLTVDAGNLWRAEQEGLFESVESNTLRERIPNKFRHPDGLWFGFSARARVILYNRERVNPTQLSTYEDLANPKWRGKILIRSSSNIYNQSLVASLVAAYGEAKAKEWLEGFTANFAREPESNDTGQIKACAAGIGDIAIANSYYYARLAKSDDPENQEVVEKVGIFFPNQGRGERGTHVNISGGGVLKTAPNKAAAIAFLEHLASDRSQRYFAEGNNEYPVVEGIETDPVLKSFGEFESDSLNVSEFGRNQATAVRLMNEVGWP